MEISLMREGIEKVSTDSGVILSCPHCSAMWMEEVEGEYAFGKCEHLRFVWWVNTIADPPTYYGEWDTREFENQCLLQLNQNLDRVYADEPLEKLCGLYDPELCRDVLQKVTAQGIDSVFEYQYEEDASPCGGDAACGFFGVKS